MRTLLKFTDTRARDISYFLRIRYGKNKNTSLSTLIKIAVNREVAAQAKLESDAAMESLHG